MVQPKSELKVVMGAMTFGEEGTDARVHDLKQVENILDIFQSFGHSEVDTARVYGNGTSEEYLGKIGWQKRGLVMETKLYPQKPIDHTASNIKRYFEESMTALQADKIEMFYLHAPDRSTPFEETLGAINELHKQGKFNRFGVSNYMAWEVAEIVGICEKNGWIKPTAYQGIYNALHRLVEPELFPCLRKFGIQFYEFNPLAGGLLSGAYKLSDAPTSGRFNVETTQGRRYRGRYWNETYFEALKIVEPVLSTHGLTMPETALRWVNHHSLLKKEYGDAVIIGASSTQHIEQNLQDLEKGPLPEQVVKALDQAWEICKPVAAKYYH
ncbi:Aldo/keto reductase [Atractiella rhizophila]|nr:Aldo/keto reductase [Atractiella rhizophila]